MSTNRITRIKTTAPTALALALFAGTALVTGLAAPAAAEFSPGDQFARHWTGQINDRRDGAVSVAMADEESLRPARNPRSGPDYWGASLARDTR